VGSSSVAFQQILLALLQQGRVLAVAQRLFPIVLNLSLKQLDPILQLLIVLHQSFNLV
jgi:hypothetical protein